jgi:hypothetical protein
MLRSIQRRCRSLSPHTYRYKQRACANDGVMDEEDFASAVLHCAVRRFGAWQVASDRSGELPPSDALQHTLCRVTLRSSVFFRYEHARGQQQTRRSGFAREIA